MSVNLQDLLAKKASEVEAPKPMPVGHYTFIVLSHEIIESAKKKTPGIEFQVQPTEAKEDVDEELLQEVKDPFKRKMRLTFWISEDSLFRLTDFLGMLGLDVEGDSSIEELIPESTGREFVAPIRQETMDNGNVIARINDNGIQAAD